MVVTASRMFPASLSVGITTETISTLDVIRLATPCLEELYNFR
jgi:hypothetical protein